MIDIPLDCQSRILHVIVFSMGAIVSCYLLRKWYSIRNTVLIVFSLGLMAAWLKEMTDSYYSFPDTMCGIMGISLGFVFMALYNSSNTEYMKRWMMGALLTPPVGLFVCVIAWGCLRA